MRAQKYLKCLILSFSELNKKMLKKNPVVRAYLKKLTIGIRTSGVVQGGKPLYIKLLHLFLPHTQNPENNAF